MKRITFWFAVGLLISLSGCISREDVPYLGRWEGSFTVDRLLRKTQVNDLKRNHWSGYILLYRTRDAELGNRCQMHMENEQEGVDLKGHWKIRGHQIEVFFNDVKIDDAGGIDLENPNRAFLVATEVRNAYSAPLILNVAPDRHQLASPTVYLGPLEGHYSFTKTSLAH